MKPPNTFAIALIIEAAVFKTTVVSSASLVPKRFSVDRTHQPAMARAWGDTETSRLVYNMAAMKLPKAFCFVDHVVSAHLFKTSKETANLKINSLPLTVFSTG